MFIKIDIDTSTAITETDLRILSSLIGQTVPDATRPGATAPARRTRTTQSPAPSAPEEKPVETTEPVVVEEPATPDAEAAGEYVLGEAVAVATKAVAAGRHADVKAALAVAGAKRVSELKSGQIKAFLTVLGE